MCFYHLTTAVGSKYSKMCWLTHNVCFIASFHSFSGICWYLLRFQLVFVTCVPKTEKRMKASITVNSIKFISIPQTVFTRLVLFISEKLYVKLIKNYGVFPNYMQQSAFWFFFRNQEQKNIVIERNKFGDDLVLGNRNSNARHTHSEKNQ